MLQLLNAHQREEYEWRELFERADPRFRYIGASREVGAHLWNIEAVWDV
jgi:hypothetical protein